MLRFEVNLTCLGVEDAVLPEDMALFKRLGDILRSYVGGISPDELSFGSHEPSLNEPFAGREHSNTGTAASADEQKIREYYGNLEIPYGSSFEEIKAAYRQMLKKYHPDVYHQSPEKRQIAEKISQRINEAYHFFESKFNKGELK